VWKVRKGNLFWRDGSLDYQFSKNWLFARMAFPFGSGYPLQSPEEKSGGFPLLSLTRKGSWDLFIVFLSL
jgi:hypothetical protein